MLRISVIIPVYNVEKFLRRCVDSVLNQTYKNLEVILVDDGSPDGCPRMCDEYAAHDSRVTVLHKKNGGLSSARNAGLDYSLNGDFVTFIDSDDWIEEDTFEYCVRLLDKNKDVDVIQYGISMTSSNDIVLPKLKEKVNILQSDDILEYYMKKSTIDGRMYSVCTCLIRTLVAKRYRFREGKINEDMDYKFKVLSNSRLWIISNQTKYYYWQEGDSTSSGKLKQRDFQLYEAAEELYNLCVAQNNKKLEYYGRVKKARTPFSLLSRVAIWGVDSSSMEESEIINKLKKELRKSLPILISAPIPISRKVVASFMAVCFPLSRYLLKHCYQ
jgi:glycosyltransferase involved in cell wall biosynthesis